MIFLFLGNITLNSILYFGIYLNHPLFTLLYIYILSFDYFLCNIFYKFIIKYTYFDLIIKL